MKVSVNKWDVVWSYIGVFSSLSSNIVIIPFIVYFLTPKMLGLWYVFASIGGLASLSDFGFTPTFARNITYCWSGAKSLKKSGVSFAESQEVDFTLFSVILSTCKKIYSLISIGILVLMLTIGTIYINHITFDIEGYTQYIAWFIFSIGTFLNLYYNYYGAFLRGVGDIKDANRIVVFARIVQLFLVVILLLLGFGIIGVSVAYLFYGITQRVLSKKKFYSYCGIGSKLSKVTKSYNKIKIKEIFREIWYNAWREGTIQLSIYLCTQASVILTSMFFSLEETGTYSLSLQLANAVVTLSATLYSTYQPTLQSAYIHKDLSKLQSSMSIILTVFTLSFLLGMILVITVGVPILNLIKPEVVINIPILIGIFLSLYVMKFRECYSSYFSCTNRLIYMKAFIFSAILCVLVSYLLLRYCKYGIWSVIIAQLFSQLIFNAWYWPHKANKELHLNYRLIFLIGTSSLIKQFNKYLRNE